MDKLSLGKYTTVFVLLLFFIYPSAAQTPKKVTVFKFSITDRSVNDDTIFLERMRSNIISRLKPNDSSALLEQDLLLSNNQLILRLHGGIDTAMITKKLTRSINLGFYGGYADAFSIITKLKKKSNSNLFNFPSPEVTSYTYLATYLADDSIAVKKMISQLALPAGHTWFFRPVEENIVELYLLNTDQPAISNDEIDEVTRFEEHWQNPDSSAVSLGPLQCVMITLNNSGAVKFAEYTKTHLSQMLSIVTGSDIIVAPIINGEIAGGKMNITSGYDPKRTEMILEKIGYPFPCKLHLISCIVE